MNDNAADTRSHAFPFQNFWIRHSLNIVNKTNVQQSRIKSLHHNGNPLKQKQRCLNIPGRLHQSLAQLARELKSIPVSVHIITITIINIITITYAYLGFYDGRQAFERMNPGIFRKGSSHQVWAEAPSTQWGPGAGVHKWAL